jgi:hypothetical protein
MRLKVRFHLLGWITLLVFPTIGIWLLSYFEQINVLAVFELDAVFTPKLLLGLEFGVFYGLIILAVSQHPIFKAISNHQERMLKSLQLNWGDIIFMSFCAAFGEEILFRVSLQTWFGPWLTSIIFIAIHGYFNPRSFKKSLLGISLLPFILILAYGYEVLGLWFCIGAHFSYDLLMFQGALKSKL